MDHILSADAHKQGSPFLPHQLLPSGHLQTITSLYLPSRWRVDSSTQRSVPLDDGDVLIVHDHQPKEWLPGDRVVLLAHGMCGSAQSGYIQRLASKLHRVGLRTIAIDLRGFGESQLTTRLIGHIGRSEDIEAVIQFTCRLCPGSPITLVGFSYGGNMSLKLIGEYSTDVPEALDSAISVCAPIDVKTCSLNLRKGLNRIYDHYFVRRLKNIVARRRRCVAGLHDLPRIVLPSRLYEFDDAYTAPLAGFRDANEYYAMCSAGPLLDQIAIPTLLLTAKDDPLIPFEMYQRFPLSPAVTLLAVQSGGHLGFIGRKPTQGDPDRRWMDWRIVEWIQAIDQGT
jgi:uncharacterized protein